VTANDLWPLLAQVSIFALPAIFAITFHEAAHGYVARQLGDDTAWKMGRVTFNPARHIDLYGTILMPLFLFFVTRGHFIFGYAKPVPVNFGLLRHPRRDMVLVALAGPATNVVLAVVSALLFYALPIIPAVGQQWFAENLFTSMEVNILLAVFNMIPIPPLDGGRVAVGLLPDVLAFPLARLERYGIFILIALLIVLPMIGEALHTNLDLLRFVLVYPVGYALNGIMWITGVHLS